MKALNSPFPIAALAALAIAGCNRGGAGGDAVATVNGEPIAANELNRYLERKPVVQVVGEDGQAKNLRVVGSLGFQAMRDLVYRKIIFQIAKDDGVSPTPADINAELAFRTKQRPEFIKELQAQGLTLEEIKRELTIDLAKDHIVTKGITVTPKEADDFIASNPEKFMTPEQAKLRFIAVKDEATKKLVDTELASGKQFGQVAIQYSSAPNVRQTQGQYGIVDVAQMDPQLQEIVRGTEAGKASAWKLFGADWVKFLVERKAPPKKVVLDDTMKEAVRRELRTSRGNLAVDLDKRLLDKLRMAKVDVKAPNLKLFWDQFSKGLQESDVKAGAGTGAPTAGGAPAAGGATTAGGAPAGGGSPAPASTAG